MITITRYQCSFCLDIFKTNNKHKCKYNPKFKNCFSCNEFKGFEEDIYSGDEFNMPYRDVTPKCIYRELAPFGMDNLQTMSRKKWDVQCPQWKLRKGKIDKKSFILFCRNFEEVR